MWMNSDLIKSLQAGIGDLLIRHPLYRYRKKQEAHYRLRVLLAAKREQLFAALSQILPNGQLLDTRLEVTVCGAAPDDRDKLFDKAPDLRRFVSVAGMEDITETDQPLAWLSFRPDLPASNADEWDYALICDGHGDPGWPYDRERLVAMMDGAAASVTFPECRNDRANAYISEETLKQIAFNTHYGYQKYIAPRATMEEIQASFEKEYNSSATLDNVLHIRSKLACCDILDADLTAAARRFAAYMKEHPDIVGRLAVVEHNRWMMEKVMKGIRLQDDYHQIYRRVGESTHSKDRHVALLPCSYTNRLTADDWRTDPDKRRPELDKLDRMSLDVHRKCREIADSNREEIFDLLDSCGKLINRYTDSSMPHKAKAVAYWQSMYSAVSHMYQKKRIATHRYDRSKQDLLAMLEQDSSMQADHIRHNIKQIDQYLESLREYIVDKDYKELDYLMVEQIPFALTHKPRPVLVKFFDINGRDCQFAPWQMESRAVTYIGYANSTNRLSALRERAERIRLFLNYSCNKVDVQFHVLAAAGVPAVSCNGDVLSLHPLCSGTPDEIFSVIEKILAGQTPDYMELTDPVPMLISAACRFADGRGIGTFCVDDSRMYNICGAEELEYPAPVKGITVREMFEQAGAVLAGCESSRMSDLSNVYREFWKVSRTTPNWRKFCDFISEAYKAQEAERTYPLYKARPDDAPQERTVRMNAQVLNRLLPVIREMEEAQYLCGIRIKWIVGDTMDLTFQVRGKHPYQEKLPADRLMESLKQIAGEHDHRNSYDIKWTDGKPEIQVKTLRIRDARLPEDYKAEFEQLLNGLENSHVINNLTICSGTVCLEFAADEFLFSLRNSGKVLEYYLYYTALQECQFDDAEVSWSFFHSAGENAAENELDVICTRGTSSLFISAKNVNIETFKDSSFLNHVCYEVSGLADTFGIHATRVLAAPRVKQFENGKLGHYVQRALSRGVYLLGDKCFENGNLSRVLDRIACGAEDWCEFLLDNPQKEPQQ